MELIEILKALADESRLRILNIVKEGEICICNLEEKLNMTQSNVSRHMTKLKNVKLVNSKRKAQWIYYSLNEDTLEKYPFIRELLFDEIDKILLFSNEKKCGCCGISNFGKKP